MPTYVTADRDLGRKIRNEPCAGPPRGVICFVLGLVALLSGCGWHQVISFSSPTGKYKAEVQQPRGWPELGARVVSRSSGADKVIGDFKGDAFITFAHCWWSKDESKFAVLMSGSFRKTIAYDVVNKRPLIGDRWEVEVTEDIVRSYGLAKATNPTQVLHWLQTSPD